MSSGRNNNILTILVSDELLAGLTKRAEAAGMGYESMARCLLRKVLCKELTAGAAVSSPVHPVHQERRGDNAR